MKTLLFLALATFATHAQAAITADYDCTDASGLTVHWEAQPQFDDEGKVPRETLYRNSISLTAGAATAKYSPDHAELGPLPQKRIQAYSRDGQFFKAVLGKMIRDDQDEQTYEGVIELKVKTPHGIIRRGKNTKVTCRAYSEA